MLSKSSATMVPGRLRVYRHEDVTGIDFDIRYNVLCREKSYCDIIWNSLMKILYAVVIYQDTKTVALSWHSAGVHTFCDVGLYPPILIFFSCVLFSLSSASLKQICRLLYLKRLLGSRRCVQHKGSAGRRRRW